MFGFHGLLSLSCSNCSLIRSSFDLLRTIYPMQTAEKITVVRIGCERMKRIILSIFQYRTYASTFHCQSPERRLVMDRLHAHVGNLALVRGVVLLHSVSHFIMGFR